MNYKNKSLLAFDEVVSGKTQDYGCWAFKVKDANDNLSKGENLICIASTTFVSWNQITRDYIYIGFHKTLDDFFNIDFGSYAIRYFYFFRVYGKTEEQINFIIEDIKSGNPDNDFNNHLNFSKISEDS